MEARIEKLYEQKLIGQYISMNFIENKTFQLWSGFMPRRKEIKNTVNSNLYSLEVFPVGHFDPFDPNNTFQKWAAVAVSDFNEVPSEMHTLVIPEGNYAVFTHKGSSNDAQKTYQAIFTKWLPNSAYIVDERPHFAVMTDKYKKDDPNAEEDIWIPIKNKI
ncbi:GyrI-like domain-containing protein [Flavobacterium sp. Fl-77]|uniref:GyrI-like domain-containing protein n=1 Tax=Flavobacterium flavipigmentatum TaxID=2893884 RepID=A0AAJ2SAZ4_9FLAO|nr:MULTISPECIES: GyrI-like domain-containing protein [unclassified Flavobacterium]MDX6181964.1 GyrI-like domain-containing protein [Flavobacterium sp. Fl-33]MDX6186981.1 GyrI-like domain-containing protein [Flavobacterium sp. Fl-77]UFH37116.1 GyrI-like domain-containing protein [Flavobacterium sp. F-70]